jgi:chemotaxis protein CheZ
MEDGPIPMLCDAGGQEAGATLKKPRKPRARRAAAAPARSAAAGSGTVVVHGALDALPQPASPAATPVPADEVYQRIGHLTRTLHDALRELGYDKELQGTREQLPDARDRLTYIARVTGEAAEKVLNAVDRARVVQEQMTATANDLRTRWLAVAAYAANDAARATPAGRDLIDQTCAFFAGVDSQTDVTKAILTDIMMAQDFHDLTGQVIRKVVTLAQNMEEQLLKLLIETTPPEQRRKIDPEKLEGPVVKAEGRDDVVTDQAGVDDLLASLGF